ncbi:MAG: hypothetical protein ACTSU5_10520 [Promethearchaeota archaeon]
MCGLLDARLPSSQFHAFARSVIDDFAGEFRPVLKGWDGEVGQFEDFARRVKERIGAQFDETSNVDLKMDEVFERILSGDMSSLDLLEFGEFDRPEGDGEGGQ